MAAAEAPLADWNAPVMVPGGNPVTADPGETPTSPPEMAVAPVFVIAEPASTAYKPADPRLTALCVQLSVEFPMKLLVDGTGFTDGAGDGVVDVNVDEFVNVLDSVSIASVLSGEILSFVERATNIFRLKSSL